MIGIISALAVEAELLIESSEKAPQTVNITGIDFHKIVLSGKTAVVAVCGVGKVNAARTAEAMIIAFNPRLIINTGVAGGLSDNLSIGDIVISEKVLQHDFDTSPLGDPKGYLSTPPLVYIPAEEVTAKLLKASAEKLGFNAVLGTIASGDQFIWKPEQKEFITSEFGASCAEMEGAAIGHVCYLSGVPFVVIRAISDGADNESPVSFPEFCKMAADNSAKLLKSIF